MSRETLAAYLIWLIWINLGLSLAATYGHACIASWARVCEKNALVQPALAALSLLAGTVALNVLTILLYRASNRADDPGTQYAWWWVAYNVSTLLILAGNLLFVPQKIKEIWRWYVGYDEATSRPPGAPSLLRVWLLERNKE